MNTKLNGKSENDTVRDPIDRILAKGLPQPERRCEDDAAVMSATELAAAAAKAPVVVVDRVCGGKSDDAGDRMRIVVETGTQGLVQLDMPVAIASALIEALQQVRLDADRIANAAGTRVGSRMQMVGTFVLGDLGRAPGVAMLFNRDEPSEMGYVLPNALFAAQLGQQLIKQAGLVAHKNKIATPARPKLIMPGDPRLHS